MKRTPILFLGQCGCKKRKLPRGGFEPPLPGLTRGVPPAAPSPATKVSAKAEPDMHISTRQSFHFGSWRAAITLSELQSNAWGSK